MPSSAAATTATYTLSLHDALPISSPAPLSHCCISTGLAKGDILRPPYYLLRRPENRTFAPNEVAVGFDASQNRLRRDGNGHGFMHRSEEHTSELQSQSNLVCRLLLPRPPRPTLFPYTTLFRSRHRLRFLTAAFRQDWPKATF